MHFLITVVSVGCLLYNPVEREWGNVMLASGHKALCHTDVLRPIYSSYEDDTHDSLCSSNGIPLDVKGLPYGLQKRVFCHKDTFPRTYEQFRVYASPFSEYYLFLSVDTIALLTLCQSSDYSVYLQKTVLPSTVFQVMYNRAIKQGDTYTDLHATPSKVPIAAPSCLGRKVDLSLSPSGALSKGCYLLGIALSPYFFIPYNFAGIANIDQAQRRLFSNLRTITTYAPLRSLLRYVSSL